jgi:hypothetical protein
MTPSRPGTDLRTGLAGHDRTDTAVDQRRSRARFRMRDRAVPGTGSMSRRLDSHTGTDMTQVNGAPNTAERPSPESFRRRLDLRWESRTH